jgi:hypothetical protein
MTAAFWPTQLTSLGIIPPAFRIHLQPLIIPPLLKQSRSNTDLQKRAARRVIDGIYFDSDGEATKALDDVQAQVDSKP